MRGKTLVLVLLALAVTATAWAQGNPTGAIRGAVTDPDGLAVPGVTVTVASPALQGVRVAVTSTNGDFLIPFLPPGEYAVTFELQGFAPYKETIGVAMAETRPMLVKLSLATVSETVTVTGVSSTEILTTGTIAQTYTSARIDSLPVGRDLVAAVLLAPGVSGNGPSGNVVIAGALVLEPEIIVADEPVSSLDASVRGEILKLLLGLRSELDIAMLVVTHDLGLAWTIADRVAVMYLGRIVEIGPAEEVLQRPLHPYTKALLDVVPEAGGIDRPFLTGEPPDPTQIPPGCRFHPRCPEVVTGAAATAGIDGACKGTDLELVELLPGHFAACHLAALGTSRAG